MSTIHSATRLITLRTTKRAESADAEQYRRPPFQGETVSEVLSSFQPKKTFEQGESISSAMRSKTSTLTQNPQKQPECDFHSDGMPVQWPIHKFAARHTPYFAPRQEYRGRSRPRDLQQAARLGSDKKPVTKGTGTDMNGWILRNVHCPLN